MAALLLPASVALAQTAGGAESSGGTAAIACNFWRGTMRMTPGLLTAPAGDQSATITGRIYGCNKSGGSANFTASLTMTAATCGSYSMQGTGTFAWADGQTSGATLVFQQQDFAPQKYLVGGAITSGPYRNLLVWSYLRFTLQNTKTDALCTTDNPAVKASFTNASSMQLVTPDTPPTFPTPSTSTPPTVPPTTATTLAPVLPTIPPTTVPGPPPGPLPNTGIGTWGAVVGAEALLIGGGLGLLGEDRRRRRARTPGRAGPRSWLEITMPPE
ncbi:MAG: hypothetical protein ACKOBG_00600 [Actinomycetota bacterium]